MNYDQLRKTSKEFNETNDCTVIATSIVCEIDYAKAHAAIAAKGRKNRHGAYDWQYHPAIKNLGFTLEKLEIESKTIRTLERELANKWGGCRVLISVRHHALAWDGQTIQDFTANRLFRVKEAFLVYPNGKRPKPIFVPVPEQKPLNRPPIKRSAVIAELWCSSTRETKTGEFRSTLAAYKAFGLDPQGHQKHRATMKCIGEATRRLSWICKKSGYFRSGTLKLIRKD